MTKFKLTGKVRFNEPMYNVLLPSGQEIYIEKRLRYLAVDEDTNLCGFAKRPVIRGRNVDYWDTSSHVYENLGCVNFKGDWRMSLMKIVKGKAVFVKQKEV